MKNISLWADSAPWIHVIPADSKLPVVEALPPTGAIFAARMRGGEMADADGVFTQFYEALRLPGYFGWNWDALRDCIYDLNWIAATRYLLIFDDAEAILSESPGERGTLFRILSDAAEYWQGKPEFPEKEKATIRALFLCRPEFCAEFNRELTET